MLGVCLKRVHPAALRTREAPGATRRLSSKALHRRVAYAGPPRIFKGTLKVNIFKRHKIKFRKLMPLADRERLTIHSASAQTKGPGIPSPPSPLTGLLLYKEVLFLNVAT